MWSGFEYIGCLMTYGLRISGHFESGGFRKNRSINRSGLHNRRHYIRHCNHIIHFHLYSPIALDPPLHWIYHNAHAQWSVSCVYLLMMWDLQYFELRQKRAREGKTDICTIDKGGMDVSKHMGLMSSFPDTFSKLIAKVIYRWNDLFEGTTNVIHTRIYVRIDAYI